MDRFEALRTFATVVEQGSFVRAADRLGVSTSAVSRSVAELETHLGVRLLNRTTRRLSLTESGRAFLERAVQLLADLEEAESAVSAASLVPRGTLRLTCAITFGEQHLAPAIAAFALRHPELRFDVELSDRIVDIVEEGFDVAIRIGSPGSQTLVARRIGETQLVCCAAPSYLAREGTPRVPEDLSRHRCLSYAYLAVRDVWYFRDADGAEHSVRIGGTLLANNGRFLARIAATGGGITQEPDFILAEELARGHLVPVLQAFAPPPLPIYIVYPSRRHLSAKVRAFADFVADRFAREVPWRNAGAIRPHRGHPAKRRAGPRRV